VSFLLLPSAFRRQLTLYSSTDADTDPGVGGHRWPARPAGRSPAARQLIREKQTDLVIANAENIAGGSGITANLFHKIRSYGIDVVTLGDHIYKRIDIVSTLQASERIVRPANLSSNAAGRPYTIVKTNSGVDVAVFALLGRIYMNLPADDPFAAADRVLNDIPPDVRVCVCDMHARPPARKSRWDTGSTGASR
jgi:calcineurin-like phosphoesterase